MALPAPRRRLAQKFGATDIVTECGDAGVARIKELTDDLGAHSTVEVAGAQEWMTRRSVPAGGHVGYVGIAHGAELPGADAASRKSIYTAARPRRPAFCASCLTSSAT